MAKRRRIGDDGIVSRDPGPPPRVPFQVVADPHVERVALGSLTALTKNPRKHGARDLGYLKDIIERVGAARSGVVDEDNVILAGNGFRAAALSAGLQNAIIVDADGQTPVFVRRRGLSAAQKAELVVADNQVATLSEWDLEALQSYADQNPDVRAGWTDKEWADMFVKGGAAAKGGKTDPDDVPPERRTSIRLGHVFQLGAHRLVCGDATQPAVVQALLGAAVPFIMVTDPPYGVEYDPSWRAKVGVNKNKKKMGKVENDDRADWREAWMLFPGVVAYVYHGGLKSSIVEASLIAASFELRSQIIWSKDRMALSRSDYHWQHEPCWYAVRAGKSAKRSSDRTQTTIWNIPAREDGGHGHGTQKPVECMARAIRNHGTVRDQVYEPFSGSGTTIIAAEQLQRQCFAIELKPTYVQMAIDRWEDFTGLKAKKVAEVPARLTTKGKN